MKTPLSCVLLVLLTPLVGCQAPLGETTYPIVTDPGLVGEWTLSEPDPTEELASEWRVSIRVERIEQSERNAGTTEFFGFARGAGPPRYAIELTMDSEELEEGALTIELEGQLVETSGGRLLTYQGAIEETGWPLRLLTTPLQYTLRIERVGDEVTLWRHAHQLVWTPTALGGRQVDATPPPDDNERTLIVGDLDEIFAYYGSADESDWELYLIAERAPTD